MTEHAWRTLCAELGQPEAQRVLRLLSKHDAHDSEKHPIEKIRLLVRLGFCRVIDVSRGEYGRWGRTITYRITDAGRAAANPSKLKEVV